MHIELNVTAFDPAKFTEPLLECRPEVPHLRIVFILEGNQNADPPHALGPLRRAASGHAAAAPPRSVINSRRCMSAPKLMKPASYRLK